MGSNCGKNDFDLGQRFYGLAAFLLSLTIGLMTATSVKASQAMDRIDSTLGGYTRNSQSHPKCTPFDNSAPSGNPFLAKMQELARSSEIAYVSWSPDQKYAVVFSDKLRIVSLETGQEVATATEYGLYYDAIEIWSHDSTSVMVLDRHRPKLEILNLEGQTQTFTIDPTTAEVIDYVMWNPNNQYLLIVTCILDQENFSTAQIFERQEDDSWLKIAYSERHGRTIPMSWSPDGRHLLTFNDMSAVTSELLEVATNIRNPLPDDRFGVDQIAWSPNSRYLLRRGGRGAQVFDLDTQNNVFSIFGDRFVNFVDWSPNGEQIAVVTEVARRPGQSVRDFDKHTLHVFSTAEWSTTPLFKYTLHNYDQTAWSPDGRYLLVHVLDTIQILDSFTGQELMQLPVGSSRTLPESIQWSPDSKYIVVPSGGGSPARIIDMAKRARVPGFEGLMGRPQSWSPDGQYLVMEAQQIVEVVDVSALYNRCE